MLDKKAIQWINKNYSMYQILNDDLGVKIPPNGLIFCPFHDNVNTKSAKYFEDTNSVYCWSEQMKYTPYKALKFIAYSDDFLLSVIPDEYTDIELPDVSVLIPDLSEEEISNELDLGSYLKILNYYWYNKNECKVKKLNS